jgi:hypothetical protein
MASKEEAINLFNNLSKTANNLADKSLKGLPEIIDKVMMPDKMIAKKIMSLKSPLMSDDDLNLMIYGKDLKKIVGPTYKPFFTELTIEKLNPSILIQDLKSPFKALPEDFPIYDEVKKIKTEVKEGVFLIEDKSKALTSEISKLAVLVGNTIPAAILIAAPINFNIPGAITLTVNLLNQISSVKQKFKELTPALRIVDKLKFVIPDSKIETVITPINVVIQTISGFEAAISPFEIFSKIQEEKQAKVDEFKNRIDQIESQINNLKIEDFVNFPDPQKLLDDKKKQLDSLKEDISTQVGKLLKQGN